MICASLRIPPRLAQLAFHTNPILGGLLNATFGNATELIVCYFALEKGLLRVVQVSLLGSILSNALLVLGFACLVAGIKQVQVKFNLVAAGSNVRERSLLFCPLILRPAADANAAHAQLPSAGCAIPTQPPCGYLVALRSPSSCRCFVTVCDCRCVFRAQATLLTVAVLSLIVPVVLVSVGQLELGSEEDLLLPRIISGFMLATYVCYVFFQLVTHKALFEEQGDEDGEDDEEEVVLSLNGAICWLAISTVLIAYLSEGLTAAIEGAAEGWGMSETFVGFIILPIVGNAAEHSTAVVMANKGKMDLAIGVALGSSTQIALMVIPTMVLLAAPMHQPLSLCFGVFETIVTFVSVLVVGMVIVDGETNWLEGVMLLMAYCIIGTAFWFYHG